MFEEYYGKDAVAQNQFSHELESAKQLALKFISTRMRTTQEVTEHLRKKGFSREQIEVAIAFLHAYQYLDDEAYCRAWIHDRIRFHPCGRQKMAVELRKKISDSQLITDSLAAYFSFEEELALAKAAAEQKIRNRTGKKHISREQLSRFLYTRGYSSSIIAAVCAEIHFSETSPDDGWWQDEL